jgi:hypothetical protein
VELLPQCGMLPHSLWLPHRTYKRCWVERAIPVPVAVLPVWDESVSHHVPGYKRNPQEP